MDQFKHLTWRYPDVFAPYPQIAAMESTRHGGVSKAPFACLNLGLHTGDDPNAVAENRRRFFAACGFRPDQTAGSRQVHGSEILKVEKPGRYEGYDALITDRAGILLTVTMADCTPVLIFDPVHEAVAAVHAGWKGTAAGIVRKALQAMAEAYGTNAPDCLAYIGTCIDYCDFEVDADVADHFANRHKKWDAGKGKFFVHLKAANRDQLLAMGIKGNQIQESSLSTFTHHQDYFSHRFEKGRTGRLLAAIGVRI